MRISSDQFTYIEQQPRRYVAEMTDLEGIHDSQYVTELSDLEGSHNFRFERLSDNSYNVGFTMVNADTKKEVDFVITDAVKHDGDLQYWRLMAVNNEKLAASPHMRSVVVIIFND